MRNVVRGVVIFECGCFQAACAEYKKAVQIASNLLKPSATFVLTSAWFKNL